MRAAPDQTARYRVKRALEVGGKPYKPGDVVECSPEVAAREPAHLEPADRAPAPRNKPEAPQEEKE